MKIEFDKYQGAGNDFIIIDNRSQMFPTENRVSLIKNLCHRKFGIGSDGLILLSNDDEVDFYMDFFNPDGSQSFCGNGSRCVVTFAKLLGIISENCTFRSPNGLTHATIKDNGEVSIKMFDVNAIEIGSGYHYMNTGSPHYNVFKSDIDRLDLISYAKDIRYNNRFQREGTNVNVIAEKQKGEIQIRTYERGVEDETWACGTGATACALSYAVNNKSFEMDKVVVATKGGKLEIAFKTEDHTSFTDIYLSGPATYVYSGSIDV